MAKDELEKAVQEVRRAIRDKGRKPEYHDDIMRKHRAEWPTLWRALDKLLQVKGR